MPRNGECFIRLNLLLMLHWAGANALGFLHSWVKRKVLPAHNLHLREIRVAGIEHVVVLVGDDE